MLFNILLLPLSLLATVTFAHTESDAADNFRSLYGFGTDEPALSAFPSSSGRHRRLEGGSPTLKANVSSITGIATSISVHYNDVEFSSSNDWIGMWPITDRYELFSAPLKFKFVCEACRFPAFKPNSTNPYPPSPPPNGTLEFTAINRRVPVVFIYVHGSAQFPESLARSQNITVDNPKIPQGGHLSLVRSDPTKMRFQWSSASTSDPHVKYGTSSGKYDKRTTCCNNDDEIDDDNSSSSSSTSATTPLTTTTTKSLHKCVTDNDCSGLCTYCQNGAGKTPPFVCHAPTGGCCLDDQDCPESYCMSGPGHAQPWKCHGSGSSGSKINNGTTTVVHPSHVAVAPPSSKFAAVPYQQNDMCDRDVQPAGLHGWFPPPSNYTALFDELKEGATYYYVYGSDEGGWSDEKKFVAAPKQDPTLRTVVAAFGDMGNVESDGSYHHSWDFHDRGEIPSSNTTKLIGADKDIDMVLHIGDISYACGFLSEWDNFFTMIEPVSTKVPWMTAIGNHEQGWSGSTPFPGTDSGGECGVPYNAYFPFASQNPSSPFPDREPWYDFSYGSVHFVVFSTEHDFASGSSQHAWLEETLASVDRKLTPWLVIAGHRPMYVDTAWPGADGPLRAALEAMFQKYKVDVAIWGHNHSYQRSCKVNNLKCIKDDDDENNENDDDDTHGIYHYVIGMAGYEMNPIPEEKVDYMVVTKNDTWGYMKMDFISPYVLETSFISDLDGSVVDKFQVTKKK